MKMDAVCSSSALLPTQKNVEGKGKAIPLQAWTGSEDFRRLRLPDFNKFGT
jgi:hypothetical protein